MLAAKEEAVAGGAGADAIAPKLHLRWEAEPLGGCACSKNQASGEVGGILADNLKRALTEIDAGDVVGLDSCAEVSGLGFE